MGWWSSVDWGSVAGAAVSLWQGNQARKDVRDAGNESAQGSEAALGLQRDIYQDQRALNMPFYNSQVAALNEWNTLMGLPGVQSGAGGSGGMGGEQYYSLSSDGTPIARADLYASNPKYRQAWDNLLREHQNQWNTGYWSGSDRNLIQGRIASMLGGNKPAGGMTTGGNQKPAQTPEQAKQAAFAKFRANPGYQFGLDEGNKQVQSSAAARGGLLSGATLKALQKFGNDYADQQGFTPYMNRLAAGAGIGQTNPVGSLTNAAGQYGQSAGGFMQNAANARASGMMNGAAARQQGWADAAGFLGQWYGGRG